MSILGDSVRTTRKLKNMSQADLATKAHVSQTTISDIERGRNDTSKELPRIAKALGVSIDALVYGAQAITPNIVPVEPWDSSTPVEEDEVEIPFYKDFLVACGHGSNGEALDSETRRLRLSKSTLRNKGIDKQNACAMTAMGDSMSPVINDQATVYVDLGRNTIKDGRIFAIERGGLFQFKYLYALPMGGVRIVSANAGEFPEEALTAQQIIEQNFKVHGWVFSWQTMVSW